MRSLRCSTRLYGRLLRLTGIECLGGIGNIPNEPEREFTRIGDYEYHASVIRARWERVEEAAKQGARVAAVRSRKHASDRRDEPSVVYEPIGDFDDIWRSLADMSMDSLRFAVNAYNYLENTALEFAAHLHAHRIGALNCGIFGCFIEDEDGTQFDVCPLSMMHNRWGFSIGFTGRRLCSICGQDIDECPHVLNQLYSVVVSKGGGSCNVCRRPSCPHSEGDRVLEYPYAIIAEADLHEVSMVRYPRDPLARPTKLEFGENSTPVALSQHSSGRRIRCFRCLLPCDGFHDPWAKHEMPGSVD